MAPLSLTFDENRPIRMQIGDPTTGHLLAVIMRKYKWTKAMTIAVVLMAMQQVLLRKWLISSLNFERIGAPRVDNVVINGQGHISIDGDTAAALRELVRYRDGWVTSKNTTRTFTQVVKIFCHLMELYVLEEKERDWPAHFPEDQWNMPLFPSTSEALEKITRRMVAQATIVNEAIDLRYSQMHGHSLPPVMLKSATKTYLTEDCLVILDTEHLAKLRKLNPKGGVPVNVFNQLILVYCSIVQTRGITLQS